MQNIQDLNEKVFFESKNMIKILEKINTVDELISKQNLINELAERVSFLQILNDKIHYYSNDDLILSDQKINFSNQVTSFVSQDFSTEVEEEEAIFNNQLNEIDEISNQITSFDLEEEAIFNNELNEIGHNEEFSEEKHDLLSFVDEDRILNNSEPEEVIEEEILANPIEIQQLDNVVFEEKKLSTKDEDGLTNSEPGNTSIDDNNFKSETLPEATEELEEEYTKNYNNHQDEMVTENSTIDSILSEIKKDTEPQKEMTSEEFWAMSHGTENVAEEESVEVVSEILAETHYSDDSEDSQEERRIKLANIKGLKPNSTPSEEEYGKADDNHQPPTIESVHESPALSKGSDGAEPVKTKKEFRLDLNDRMAFTKMLFGGSQSELNYAVFELNNCKNIEEAKEYLSDLYYAKDWGKADEYAQRLWILVENKFL